jgi:hypothetical protein
VNSPVIESPPKCPILVETRGYFKAGSINVRSVAGSNRFCIVIGSTVAMTSRVAVAKLTSTTGKIHWSRLFGPRLTSSSASKIR